MRFSYLDSEHGLTGPYSVEELQQLLASGTLTEESRLFPEGSEASLSLREVFERFGAGGQGIPPGAPGPQPPPLPGSESSLGSGSGRPERFGGFAGRARQDLKVLLPHLSLPFEELRNFRFLENRKALAIALIGLAPLFIYALFRHPSQLGNAFWAMALYFSVLWALFFYYVFPTPEAKLSTASICFFGTGAISISVLLILYRLWPLSRVDSWIGSGHVLGVWSGFILGVGVPEELCKACVLFFILRRFGPIAPRAVLFYGLISGLGFGIYEGIKYQTQHNFQFAIHAAGEAGTYFAAEYYLLNLIRLTTLPFLHAIWTGIAGYFIGFAAQYPERKRGLLIVAIGIPAVLHGSYNTFTGGIGLAVALVSVLALNLYLAKSVDFEKLLGQGQRVQAPEAGS